MSYRLPLQSSVHDTANGFMMLPLPQCACWQAWQFTPQIMCCYEPAMQAGAAALSSSFYPSAHSTIVYLLSSWAIGPVRHPRKITGKQR